MGQIIMPGQPVGQKPPVVLPGGEVMPVAAPKKTPEQKALEQRILYEIKDEVERRLRMASTDKREVFIGLLLLKCEVTVGERAPTACIRLSRTGLPIIEVAPTFWASLADTKERFGVLVHELYHCVMEHFSRFDASKENPQLLNIAMDCAINQLIDVFAQANVQVGGVSPINFHSFVKMVREADEKKVIGAIEEKQTAEYYLRILKQVIKGNGGGKGKDGDGGAMGKIAGQVTDRADGSGKILANDHSQSQAEGEETDSLTKSMFKDQIRRTMYQAGVGHGSELGIDMEDKGKVNWKQILRHFINRSVKAETKKTKNRPNKRYGYIAAKRIKDKKTQIDVLCDTSRSMGYVLPIVFSELLGLANETADFTLWSVDTVLTNCGKIKNKRDLKNVKVPQGGGTCFETALPELQSRREKRPVIFITDTYGEFPENPPSFDFIILTTEERVYDGMPEWARRKALDISEILHQRAEEQGE